MELYAEFVSTPSICGYLPDKEWQFENALVASMTSAEYERRMEQGWRRFGRMLFRPRCPSCTACQSLRVDIAAFRPNRAQRRNRRDNEGMVQVTIQEPSVAADSLALYDRFHAHQSRTKGWPEHPPGDAVGYFDSFVDQPFPVEEWRYTVGDTLVGVGIVDRLPHSLSAVYFFSEPAERTRGLGTWNVLCVLDRARKLEMPYLYLGYHIPECSSLAYKANFAPNQKRSPAGEWQDFRS